MDIAVCALVQTAILLHRRIKWIQYNDKIYQFMVNGQTGKVSGKTPISAVKVIITILAVLAILGLFRLIGSVMEEY